MKKLLIYLGILFLMSSCGNVGKVLRNEKITNTDEFLVKKKGPLVFPPNYEEIPAPDTISKQKEDQQSKIKKILRAPKKEDRSLTNSSSIEDSILKKIRK